MSAPPGPVTEERDWNDPRRKALRVLVVSGPNLDRLGRREPEIYGTESLDRICAKVELAAARDNVSCVFLQSNYEGEIVGALGRAGEDGFDGVILNAGAYTHTSVAILDAIKAGGVPVVEVHLSNPDARESFRRKSIIAPVCLGRVAGFGGNSYVIGLMGLAAHLRKKVHSSKKE